MLADTRRQDDLLARAALQRYARGDAQAFEELYRARAPRVYRLCIYLAGRAEADTLLQEVFTKIHRARASFDPEGCVLHWAFAIARTSYLERGASPAGPPPASGSSLEHESELARLPEALRTPYVLVQIERLTDTEAGQILGLTANATRQRVQRASAELNAQQRRSA
jgi:RNA polymerase sigma-70 factor (ECF subfamily)